MVLLCRVLLASAIQKDLGLKSPRLACPSSADTNPVQGAYGDVGLMGCKQQPKCKAAAMRSGQRGSACDLATE